MTSESVYTVVSKLLNCGMSGPTLPHCDSLCSVIIGNSPHHLAVHL